MIGRFGGRNHLRHTGVIKRGNVRSEKSVRDFHFGSDGNCGEVRKASPAARAEGTEERGSMEGKRG